MAADGVETPASSRSSILYAMGKLTAETSQLAAEHVRLREAQEELPEKIALAMSPRFTAIETKQIVDSGRIDALERWRWKAAGGLVVIVMGVGWGLSLVKPLIPIP